MAYRKERMKEAVSDTSSNRGLSVERASHVVSVLRPLLHPSLRATGNCFYKLPLAFRNIFSPAYTPLNVYLLFPFLVL